MTGIFEKSLYIERSPEDLFDYFIRAEKLVTWMGEYAELKAENGGTFLVDIDGVLIRGHYLTIEKPHKIVVAWGEAGNALMPPGSTTLSIVLQVSGSGTLLHLQHSGLVESELAKHSFGWPHFLERLAKSAVGMDPGLYPWKT